jgi:hypothetical protein
MTLDGLCSVVQYKWPRPVFDGKGEMQAIIDAHASPEQRQALSAILHGEETKRRWRFPLSLDDAANAAAIDTPNRRRDECRQV